MRGHSPFIARYEAAGVFQLCRWTRCISWFCTLRVLQCMREAPELRTAMVSPGKAKDKPQGSSAPAWIHPVHASFDCLALRCWMASFCSRPRCNAGLHLLVEVRERHEGEGLAAFCRSLAAVYSPVLCPGKQW